MRLVLIEIADNTMADQFVKYVQENNDVAIRADLDDGNGTIMHYIPAKAEGMWAVPTLFCECEDYLGKSVMTKAYRWWVHAKCSKPRRTAPQSITRNLLEPESWPIVVKKYVLSYVADRTDPWIRYYGAGKK